MPFVLLTAAVLALPWYFGGATSLGHFSLAACVAMSVLATLIHLCFQRAALAQGAVDRRMTFVLLGAILLGVLQLVPLGRLQSVLAPTAYRWRSEMQESGRAGRSGHDGPMSVTTRSIYPAATRHALGLLLVASAACVLAMRTFGGGRTSLALLVVGTISGVGLALFGMAQALRGVDQPFGVVTLVEGGSIFGPYVNRNNAGGFLNLCLACSVGLVVWSQWRRQVAVAQTAAGQVRQIPTRMGGLADVTGIGLLIWAAMIVVAAGVVATVSRGAVLALLLAAIVSFILVRPWMGRSRPVSALFGLAAVALVLAAWLGPLQQVRQRFDESLAPGSQAPASQDGRFANWKEALYTWVKFPVWGSGLDTYSYAYLRYQTRDAGTKVHGHAENQFVQALSDAGVAGLALLLAAIVVMTANVRCLAAAGDRNSVSLAVAGCFALVSQIVGGSFDFGLYLPANALLMAVVCGSVCGRAAGIRADASANRTPVRSWRIANPWTMGLLYGWLCFGNILASWDFWQRARIERWTDTEMLQAVFAARDEESLQKPVERLAAAVSSRADDADGNFALALLWLERFRLQLFDQFKRAQPWQNKELLWDQTASLNLVAAQKRLYDTGAPTHPLQRQVDALRSTLDIAREYLGRAIRACPWDVRFHLQDAEALAVLGQFAGADRAVGRAEPWAGGNPETWYQCGLLRFLAGNDRDAQAAWKRSLELSPQFAPQIKAWQAERSPPRDSQ